MKDLHTLGKYRLKEKERSIYGRDGDGGCWCFKVYANGRSFNVIDSNGGGWEHVSVSPWSDNRKCCHTWEDMCAIKNLFFEPEERVVQYHPPESEYVNNHPYCLHLWKPTTAVLPFPPAIFV